MFYTYILKSKTQPGAIYIGYTDDLKLRILEHNNVQGNHHTTKYKPWEIETYIAFTNKNDAKRFEQYLKTHSGKAFLRKRLISNRFKEALAKFNNGRNKKISETQ